MSVRPPTLACPRCQDRAHPYRIWLDGNSVWRSKMMTPQHSSPFLPLGENPRRGSSITIILCDPTTKQKFNEQVAVVLISISKKKNIKKDLYTKEKPLLELGTCYFAGSGRYQCCLVLENRQMVIVAWLRRNIFVTTRVNQLYQSYSRKGAGGRLEDLTLESVKSEIT